MQYAETVLDLIGRTPLVRLNSVTEGIDGRLRKLVGDQDNWTAILAHVQTPCVVYVVNSRRRGHLTVGVFKP